MRKTLVQIGVVLCCGMAAHGAVFYDGFEDGNTTSNPAWYDDNPGFGVDGGVVADPIRPGNLVWKVMGAEAAGRRNATRDFTPLAWQGFHASVEYLITTSSRFQGGIEVGQLHVPGDPYTGFQVGLSHDITWVNTGNLCILEHTSNGTKIFYDEWFDLSLMPINQWVTLDLWHDPTSGLVISALRNSEGQVIVENSITPSTFGGDTMIGELDIFAQELEWQYMDNPTLVPEPLTLGLLAMGVLGVLRRRA